MSSLEHLPQPSPANNRRSNRVSMISACDAQRFVVGPDENSNTNIDVSCHHYGTSIPPTINSSSKSQPHIHCDFHAPHHQTNCTDVIDRIIQASESRLGYSSSSSDDQLKLTAEELDQLSLFSTVALDQVELNPGSKYSWTDVDVESLTALCTILENHVRASVAIDFIQEARAAFDRGDKQKWYKSNERQESPATLLLASLRQGLQASTILLSIMISPSIDRRLINEDAIDAIIRCMRNHIGRNVIPALSNTGHTAPYAPRQHSSGMPASSSTTAADMAPPPAKKQKRKKSKVDVTAPSSTSKVTKASQQQLVKFLRTVYKPITSTVGLLANLMERLDLLIRNIPIDDQPLLSICSSVLSSLTIDPSGSSGSGTSTSDTVSWTHVIQSSSISIISAVFQMYPRHRIVILEDLFPLFLKIPTSKKSIRTFCVRLGSIANNSDKLRRSANGGKSIVSSSSLVTPQDQNGGDGLAYIQVITALILTIVQSCVTMPHSVQPDERMKEGDETQQLSQLTSGLLECEHVCQIFTSLLIQRCSKKREDGGASEFRPILFNLVEDLLMVQILPEYPSAEMLLMEIARKLCDDLLANSSVGVGGRAKKSALAEATYLSTAMDTIGNICSDIARKIGTAKESPLEFPKAIDLDSIEENSDPSNNEKEVNRCFCGRKNLLNTFMLDCDRCHGWFHGSCIGIAKDNLPDVWVCDECTMQLLVLDQMKKFSLRYDHGNDSVQDGQELAEEDRVHIMRILLLNFLSHQANISQSSAIRLARQFHIAKFIDDAKFSPDTKGPQLVNPDVICAHYLDMWSSSDQDSCTGHSTDNSTTSRENSRYCEYLSDDGNSKLMLTLNASKSLLIASYPHLLGVIVALMGDESNSSLRKLAVKALSQIVQVDKTLMATRNICEAVAKRFQDEAISVREAAVSLVGVYVLQVPELALSFHAPLLQRLNDAGVSVRKRAIKIFRDIMSSNPSYPMRANVFTKLLQQAVDRKEDDGVRDLIHDTFITLWFANYKSFGKVQRKRSLAAIVTPIGDTDLSQSNTAHDTAKQLVEVVSLLPSRQPLVKLVQEIINGQGDKDEGKKISERKIDKNAAECYCASIVTFLIEELVTFEEERDKMKKDIAEGPRLVALLTTLHVFADASPLLLVNHYDTLLHYLKADNGVDKKFESSIVLHICKILCQVSNCLNENDIQRLGREDLPNDLVKVTYKFGSSATAAAVETLTKLATHSFASQDSPLMKSLMKLARTFYSHLVKMKDVSDDFSKISERERTNVHRALSVLGCISRYHDTNDTGLHDADLDQFVVVSPSELEWGNFPSSSFAIFETYLNKLDTATKCKSLRAMSGIFSAHPRIMLAFEQRGVWKDIMSDQDDPDLQLEALQCWRDILVCEEVRVESGEAKRQMESKDNITTSKKVSGDQDGDASLIGACCIQHAPRLFELTSNQNAAIRFHTLLLIETLKRQGLLNPMEMVPHLFALQGDLKQPQIRALALKLLMEEGSARPSIIRQLLAEGIKQSYYYQRKVYPDANRVTALMENQSSNEKVHFECIFGQIFRDSIRTSRTHSIRVIKSLLMLFSSRENKMTKHAKSTLEKVPMLSFASEVIAYLPYNHLGDVLFIIHYISGIIALEGHEILTKLVTFLRPYGLSSDDKDPNNEECKLESAAMRDSPSKVKELGAMRKKSFNVSAFVDLCGEASALLLLLRLSNFLREAYSGVTTTRLLEYLPGEKERVADRGVNRVSNIAPFDSYIPHGSNGKGKKSRSAAAAMLDNSIRQYAEFRKLMREYDNRMSVHSDDDTNAHTSQIPSKQKGNKRKRTSSDSEVDDF